MPESITMLLTDDARAEPGAPAPDRLVDGSPLQRTWNSYESPDGTLFAGIWESTPGCWRVVYDEWEFCHIISGVSELSGEDGSKRVVRAGDAFTIAPGFRGTWRVVETTRKHYVIKLP